MLAIGVALALSGLMTSYASYAIHGGVGGADLGAVVEAVDQPMWIPIVAIPATFLLLIFPEGRLLSPRWRWFAGTLGVSMSIAFLAILLAPGKMTESSFPDL